MVHSLYQSLNNLETIYADRIGIRYYDEAKGGVVEVPFRQYAVGLRRFVAFLRSRTPNPLGQQQLPLCDVYVRRSAGRGCGSAPEHRQELGRDPLRAGSGGAGVRAS